MTFSNTRRSKRVSRLAAAAATFALVACSDGNDTDRMPPVGAKGRSPGAAERGYAADRESAPRDRAADRDVRQRDEGMLQPADRPDATADSEITRKLREALASGGGTSAQARNVEVDTADGTVTLRGTVTSEEEKARIESSARSAGATRVDNRLEVDREESSDESERG